MGELKKETNSLTESVVDISDKTQTECQRVSQIKLQIQALEAEARKNLVYFT